MKTLSLFAFVLLAIVGSLQSRQAFERIQRAEETRLAPQLRGVPLYLPQAKYLKAITFGFNNAAADLLWFQTLNYFGKHIAAREDMPWFFHMCSLVTELDPKAEHVYEFCGTLLSWVAQEPAQSSAILDRAIEQFPNRWRFYYLRGFNAWYFDRDRALAAEMFRRASRCPGAPPLIAGVASRLLVAENDAESAVRFLTEVLQSTKSADARKAILERLNRARLTLDLETLEKARDRYETTTPSHLTTIEQLVESGIIAGLPSDPFGGTYFYDPSERLFFTTSGEKPLRFGGKSAALTDSAPNASPPAASPPAASQKQSSDSSPLLETTDRVENSGVKGAIDNLRSTEPVGRASVHAES